MISWNEIEEVVKSTPPHIRKQYLSEFNSMRRNKRKRVVIKKQDIPLSELYKEFINLHPRTKYKKYNG